jgi:predicted component of type VI protein secretion system
MAIRLVALDDGPDIPIDREMLIVGRHPQCDARLDSIRVSRRHCCMSQDSGEVIVRDLGSTNGIRINGQRVEKGRLRIGDELSIAHIRFRLDDGQGQEQTMAESASASSPTDGESPAPSPRPVPKSSLNLGQKSSLNGHGHRPNAGEPAPGPPHAPMNVDNNPLAAAVRDLLPPNIAERCRIQVIVQMDEDDRRVCDGFEEPSSAERPISSGEMVVEPSSSSEPIQACPPDSSL